MFTARVTQSDWQVSKRWQWSNLTQRVWHVENLQDVEASTSTSSRFTSEEAEGDENEDFRLRSVSSSAFSSGSTAVEMFEVQNTHMLVKSTKTWQNVGFISYFSARTRWRTYSGGQKFTYTHGQKCFEPGVLMKSLFPTWIDQTNYF